MKNRILVPALALATASMFMFFQSDDLKASVERGKTVYENNCMSCHQEDGAGVEGAFPPLAQTGNLKDKGKLVKIVLNGLSGPITVKGQQYDTEMSGISLSDEEVADVLNYVRNSWGNKEPVIKVAEVKKLKQ